MRGNNSACPGAFAEEQAPRVATTLGRGSALKLDSLACKSDSQLPLDHSARWMAVSFSPDGLIISVSSSAESLTGYSARELVGRPITQIMADRSVFEVPQMMDAAKEWGCWSGEVSHRNRSGKQIASSSSLTLLSGCDNENIGFLLVSVFSEHAESSRCSNADIAEISCRLRAFAHELNNPLAVVMGITQLMLLNPQCQGRVRIDMDKLFSEMKRVIQVVEKLHGYAISLQESQSQCSIG
jgi:PAS domain S-box-containing protein